MRKLFFLFLALVATTSLWAHDFEVDGIYYNYLDGNNVEVTYRGSHASYYNEYAGEFVIPSTVTYNGTTYSVTSIGGGAFSDCTSLTSITIPNSVTSIGGSAFSDCTSLTSVTIPNSVTSIGGSAFSDCTSLTSVTIPNSVTSIGDGAFAWCDFLTSMIVENGNTIYDSRENCNAIIETATNTLIAGCQQTVIPNSVTSIGDEAFYSCRSLTSITIPNSVTSIGSYAFCNCDGLTSISIPNSVTSIGGSAFCNCDGLTSISIPNSVTSIGGSAFSDCTSLTSITIPNSVTSIGNSAFSGCSSLASITIPNSVTTVGGGMFYGCSKLKSVVLSNNITSLPTYRDYYYDYGFFENCSSIISITIPNSVTSIGDDAFYQCEKLGTLVLGDKVKEIGEEAFNGCNKLYHIYCYAPEPPMAYESSFANYNVNLYVPCNYLDNYKYDRVFGSFRYIQCIESEDVTTDDVVVTPGTNDVTITWPTEGNADTYTIVIKKDGEVVCTLTFNADGQLLNIAFAPGRDGNHPAQYAEAVANGGYRFTVTGLEEGTHYTYDITVKDASNQTINSHIGEFSTQSTTAVDNITTTAANIQKIMRNGQLIIIRDGVEYNAMGQEIQ